MSNLLAKQFYLDQIKKDNAPHRLISKRMAEKFDVSPALIKNELLRDGLITVAKTVRVGQTQRLNYFFKITGKKLTSVKPEKPVLMECWEDGTPKSKGNAFDLSISKGLFTRAELASSQNKGKPHNFNTPVQVIAYSRA